MSEKAKASAKVCPCGHPKSQHYREGDENGWHMGGCDYSGYACGCAGWMKPPDEALLAKVRKAMLG